MNSKNDCLHRVRFMVSLSDGSTFYEGKGEFKDVPGLPSPWQRIIKFALDRKLEITSLSLYTEDGQTFNLPSAGKNPRFSPFNNTVKPLDYHLCRYMSRDIEATPSKVLSTKISDWFTVIEAIYSEYKLQIWVDEANPKNCWSLIVSI